MGWEIVWGDGLGDYSTKKPRKEVKVMESGQILSLLGRWHPPCPSVYHMQGTWERKRRTKERERSRENRCLGDTTV